VCEVAGQWGEAINENVLSKALQTLPQLKAVFIQHCETSTAALHPLKLIRDCINKFFPSALLVVDGITSIGVTSVSMKEYGIDALVGGSQKALMLPPGLSMITMSERAWDAVAQCKRNRFYFHLEKERKQQEQATTAWTPAIGLILGLQESLRMIEAEGKENIYARHAAMSKAARAGLKGLGFQLMAEDCVSPGLTAGFAPYDIDTGMLLKQCLKTTGVRIAGGQDHLKGKIIRMGHMGYTDVTDVLTGLVSLGRVMHTMRPEIAPAAGVAAACRALAL
jgi:serine---pyruvate transaminase